MIALPSGARVYLACGHTDLRKGMVGLAMLLQQGLAEDPFSGTLYGIPWTPRRADKAAWA
jgi:transposase